MKSLEAATGRHNQEKDGLKRIIETLRTEKEAMESKVILSSRIHFLTLCSHFGRLYMGEIKVKKHWKAYSRPLAALQVPVGLIVWFKTSLVTMKRELLNYSKRSFSLLCEDESKF